jgi:peptidyl-prolyl cis-trans isomerase D
MATLQSIRNHGTILLVVVGIAMLAFILGDFLNSGSSFFNKNLQNVAEIAGHTVNYSEYETAIKQLRDVTEMETGQRTTSEEQESSLRNQVWQTLLIKYNLLDQTEKIGMVVTSEEENQQLLTATNNFNGLGLQYLQYIQTASEPEKKYWDYVKDNVSRSYLQEKYNTLLSHLIAANPIDAKYAFEARQNSVDVQYVQQPYYAVADSLVKVTDSDIKKLYKQKKELYKQTPNRSIKCVSFPILPSDDDIYAAENQMKKIENDFITKDDIISIANTNPDIECTVHYYSINTIPAEFKEFAFGKKVKKGDYTGIMFQNNTFAMARIMNCGFNKADSVLLALANNPEAKQWFNTSVLPLNIVNGKNGETFALDGLTVQIIEKSKATPKVELATITKTVTASSKTRTALTKQAELLAAAHTNADSLLQDAQTQGHTIIPAYGLNKNSENVAGIKGSREIVKWAFDAKLGDISKKVYNCEDQLIVAALTEVKDGEYLPLEDVKAELTFEATNQKKAEYIKTQLQSTTTLADAAKLFDTEVKNVENVTLNTYRLGAAGHEPLVIGSALVLEPNTVSKPIIGNNGVYMITVNEPTKAAGELDTKQEILQLNWQIYNTILRPEVLTSMLVDIDEVVDNRADFQ